MIALYTPVTLAKEWQCSTTLIYDLLNSGALQGFRIGDLWRIRASAVKEYEAAYAVAPAAHSGQTEDESNGGAGKPSPATVSRLERLTA